MSTPKPAQVLVPTVIEEGSRGYRAFDIYSQLLRERIVFLGMEDNWWATGDEGPCGPDTEIFYDTRAGQACDRGVECKPGCGCKRWVEIWNSCTASAGNCITGPPTVLSLLSTPLTVTFTFRPPSPFTDKIA